MAWAHEPQRVKNRVTENRYFCYDPDELITQLDMLNHSREIWRPGDRALMTHDLIEIYKICRSIREHD